MKISSIQARFVEKILIGSEFLWNIQNKSFRPGTLWVHQTASRITLQDLSVSERLVFSDQVREYNETLS